MKRVLLTISFDGTAYHGWQIQPNAITVQEVIEGALGKILGTAPSVTGCSRTDAGVHAREFCLHFDCDEKIPADAFLRGLVSLLPQDISVIGYREVPSDFHARYSAKGKTYEYKILNSNIRDPFLSRYTWQIGRKLNIDKMNKFCERLIGEHDFYAFSSSGRTVDNTVRTISECYVESKDDIVKLSVTGNGFLYNMVRIIVGTAVEVSDGRINPQDTEKILLSRDRSLAGITAPPQGLSLEKVIY